jgi:hypothetical protein
MSTRRNSTTEKRQKSQYSLAFPKQSRGAAPTAIEGGTESELAKRTAESPATEQWMEEVCERENCKQALQRVKANKGSPGVDGMTVDQSGIPNHTPSQTQGQSDEKRRGPTRAKEVSRIQLHLGTRAEAADRTQGYRPL